MKTTDISEHKDISQGQFCRLCNAWRGDLGLEPTPELYLDHMMLVMAEVWRVLRDDGVCFVNIGDSYWGSGPNSQGTGLKHYWGTGKTTPYGLGIDTRGQKSRIKPKSLCLIPQKFAIRCQEAGWIIRSEIIWAKPNPMPESVKDRPTRSHEQVWIMTKQGRYFWDQDAVREPAQDWGIRDRTNWSARINAPLYGQKPNTGGEKGDFAECGRNIRDVWTIATEPTPEAHFATWPSKLVERMIRAATSHKACPKCLAPWERMIEKGELKTHPAVWSPKSPHQFNSSANEYVESGTLKKVRESKTLGFRPTCKCKGNDGSGRCIVLDPFCGTAKTVIEAEKLNRIGIGLDLSWSYLSDIAKPRLSRPLQKEMF